MPFLRGDVVTNVQTYLKIGSGQEIIFDSEIGNIIDDGVEKHSEIFPREMRYDVIGNGEYNYHLPSDWTDGLSEILDIEFPYGEQTPNDIDRNTIRLIKVDTTARAVNNASSGATSITLTTAANAAYYKDGDPLIITNGTGASAVTQTNWASADGNRTTGVLILKNALSSALNSTPTVKKADHIRFIEDAPTAPEVFTIKYGIQHTLSDSINTIPSNDCRAFCHLVASLMASAISANFAKYQDSSFSADAVNYGEKANEWREIAKDQYSIYAKHFGIGDGEDAGTPAAGSFTDTDFTFQHGAKFLFHSGKYR